VLSKQKPTQKRSPPHILADEHFKEVFNPPAADYRVLDAFLRWLENKVVIIG